MKLGEENGSAKKIGLFACTGVVAGNMNGSGIALLPANLASIGGIAIWGWIISIGAMSLAHAYADWQQKTRKQGGPIAYAGNIPHLVFRQVFFITMLTGLVTWRLVLPRYLNPSTFFPDDDLVCGYRCIVIVWYLPLKICSRTWVSRLTTIGWCWFLFLW